MNKHNKLTQTINLIVSGGLMLGAVTTASAHVAYNKYNAHNSFTATDAGGNGPDGWVWGRNIGSSDDPAAASPGFAGTANDEAPFGYIGAAALNWAAHLHSSGSEVTVSQQDAYDRYGIYPDIDTAAGAWQDSGLPQGWSHNTDIGLLKSNVTQYVHLAPSVIIGNQFANFGITVFKGQSLSNEQGGGYSHHASWNRTQPDPFDPLVTVVGEANPFGIKGLETVTGWDDTVDEVHPFTFLAEAGEVYSIFLGGSGGINWNGQHDGYALDITTSAVPVPGAVWLFGSAAAGLLGYQRKRKSAQ